MGAALAWETEAAADPFAAARARFEQLLRVAGSEETQRMQHSDLERLLAEQGQELMRELYQNCVDQQAQAEVTDEVVDAAGKERTRKRTQQRELETIFGTVEVQRTGYGAEGAASLHPLDAQLNLPDERYSLEVRRRAALEASKNSFDETVETLSRYTGAAIGKRQVEELVGRAAQDFDAFYQRRHQQATAAQAAEAAAEPPAATGAAPEDAVPAAGLLVISSDAKGVVMHRQDLRPATRKASERTRSKLGTGLSKGEKRNRKRMATVAAVYSVASHVRTPEQMLAVLSRDEEAEQKCPPRPRPQHKRVWASLEQEPREVLQEAFREALQRDPQGNQIWVAVVDGNETQLTILKELAKHYGLRAGREPTVAAACCPTCATYALPPNSTSSALVEAQPAGIQAAPITPSSSPYSPAERALCRCSSAALAQPPGLRHPMSRCDIDSNPDCRATPAGLSAAGPRAVPPLRPQLSLRELPSRR